MQTYTILREFADSWFLIAMFGFFAAAAIWAYLPSQKKNRIDASQIPFRDEAQPCEGGCESCGGCKNLTKELTHD